MTKGDVVRLPAAARACAGVCGTVAAARSLPTRPGTAGQGSGVVILQEHQPGLLSVLNLHAEQEGTAVPQLRGRTGTFLSSQIVPILKKITSASLRRWIL